ncbi:MAG: helix-turn-helix domain-containing protein [Candidatus Thorarchaeota archaeon]
MTHPVSTDDRALVEACPVFRTLSILKRRWTILVLQGLMAASDPRGIRFTDIHQRMGWVSRKVLTEHLRDLEAEGLLTRTVDSSGPTTNVYYALTDRGNDLRDILDRMRQWGLKHGGPHVRTCPVMQPERCGGCPQDPQ